MKLTALRDTAAPEPEKTAASANTKPTKPKDACAAWLKPLAGYDRRERREYQVTRFG
jgi:hypothetical protein